MITPSHAVVGLSIGRFRSRNRHLGVLCCLLSFVLSSWCGFVQAAGVGADHVVVIGIDGLSPDGVRVANTPHLHALMKDGAFTLHARGVMPTSSSPNWASMIMGAGPEQHGVTSNDWETNKYEIAPIEVGPGGIFPTIFGVLHEQQPEAVIACFHDWDGFGRLLEQSAVNVLKHVPDAIETTAHATKYIVANKPNFLFVHFDGVDHAGHGFGWKTEQYYKEVEMVDALIGAILSSLKEADIADKTIVLVTADHGGKGKKHGGPTMDEIEIPWIINGPGVGHGKELKTHVNTYDTAATLAFIFGLKPPDVWIGKPVLEAFTAPR
jgi:predicted AlkP superfamily pyrophosphatase or phosphodiesterase